MKQNTGRTAGSAGVRYLDRGEGRVAYEVFGAAAAPLVLCVPGMGDLRQAYRHNIEPLVAAGYRVAAMDLRGHGDSDASFERYDDPAAASDMIALAEELGAPALLFGNSMAASAAVIAAAQRPDVVAGLVLAGPFTRDQPIGALAAFAMRAALVRPWGVSAWLSYYTKLFTSRRPADLAEHKARIRASLRRPAHWKAFVATTRQTTHAVVEPYVSSVKAPALVVMGTKDPDFKDPVAEARLVAEQLGGEQLLVEGAGHYAMAEFPDVVNPRVLQFADAVFRA